MRRDEVRKLHWHQVNLIDRVLTVGKGKNRESTGRRIPLNSATVAILEIVAGAFSGCQAGALHLPGLEHHHIDPTRRCVASARPGAAQRARLGLAG